MADLLVELLRSYGRDVAGFSSSPVVAARDEPPAPRATPFPSDHPSDTTAVGEGTASIKRAIWNKCR